MQEQPIDTKRQWLLCPLCQGKSRMMLRNDTTLRNFPLFCPKCKKETVIDVKDEKVTIINEPDA